MSPPIKTPVAIGDVFGRLTVVESVSRTYDLSHWRCRCACGTERVVVHGALVRGATRSCGCLRREVSTARTTTHGGYGSPAHGTWKDMLRRCEDPSRPGYPNYGGRGIRVCDRWHDFTAFSADVGERPSPRHSLDRIDNARGYEPGNVRWATRHEQSRNTRRNIRLTHNGETMVLADWAKRLGVPWARLYARIKAGWPAEAALTLPRYAQH